MLSLQRSSNHQPWFTQQMANAGSSIPAQNYWLQMSVKNSTGSPPAETSSTSSSSCTASTTVPPPLASSSSSTGSQINSFYPSQDDVKRKQTRATLRTVNDYREPNLPLDPRCWLREDVQTWIRHMSEVHGLPAVDTDRFLMNGKALCLMTIEMFCQRVPLGGKMLYKDFQLRLSMAMYS